MAMASMISIGRIRTHLPFFGTVLTIVLVSLVALLAGPAAGALSHSSALASQEPLAAATNDEQIAAAGPASVCTTGSIPCKLLPKGAPASADASPPERRSPLLSTTLRHKWQAAPPDQPPRDSV
jgi:hypothetical protein